MVLKNKRLFHVASGVLGVVWLPIDEAVFGTSGGLRRDHFPLGAQRVGGQPPVLRRTGEIVTYASFEPVMDASAESALTNIVDYDPGFENLPMLYNGWLVGAVPQNQERCQQSENSCDGERKTFELRLSGCSRPGNANVGVAHSSCGFVCSAYFKHSAFNFLKICDHLK